MGTVFRLEPSANYELALKRIRHLWDTGKFEQSDAVIRQIMAGEFDTTDIQYVIGEGRIIADRRNLDCLRYVIRGEAVDGGVLKVEVELGDTSINVARVVVSKGTQ